MTHAVQQPIRRFDPVFDEPVAHSAPHLMRGAATQGQHHVKAAAQIDWDVVGPRHWGPTIFEGKWTGTGLGPRVA